MIPRGAVRFLTAAALLTLVTPAAVARTADRLFREALEDDSTSPGYVLITLVSGGGARRRAAIVAPFLLGAIHQEHHLGFDKRAEAAALRIALDNRERVFEFKDPTAAKNVQPRYSEQVLAEVRAQLEDLGDRELVAGFRHGPRHSGPLHAPYTRNDSEYVARRDAIAQVLLERGLPVHQADRSGLLIVGE